MELLKLRLHLIDAGQLRTQVNRLVAGYACHGGIHIACSGSVEKGGDAARGGGSIKIARVSG